MSPLATPVAPASTPVKTARPLRVCHLSMTLLTGGLERLLVDYGRFHDSNTFQLHFAALEDLGQPADDLRNDGFDVHSFQLSKTGKLRTLWKVRDYLKAHQIDVLHTHNTYPYFYGAIAGWMAGTPVIVNTQHGRGCGPGVRSLWQFRIANRFGHYVGGVSKDATLLCQEQDRGAASKMHCIWNGIDLERFEYHGPRAGGPAISVGRLSPEKDFATLIRAVKHVVAEYPDFRLKLVGNGAERENLEALTNELELTDVVEFLGERSDVPALLRDASLFVASSRTEGISLTLLEAMAVGLPIVTTSVGGNPEIVVEGETGYLAPSENPESLAQAICKILAQRNEWDEFGKRARDRVEEYFCIRHMISNYESAYKELYSKSKRGALAK
ncbi:MAG: glycosyltransferase [Planctomycetaceae bacterium]